MKKLLTLFLCLVLSLTFVACANNDAEVMEEDYKLMVSEDGVVTFKVKGNPTTGYEWTAWEVTNKEMFSNESFEGVYEQDAHEDGMAGVGGVYTFSYPVVEAGECDITFCYARSWESVQPVDKKVIHVERDEEGNVTANIAE